MMKGWWMEWKSMKVTTEGDVDEKVKGQRRQDAEVPECVEFSLDRNLSD
jgi:hypothetical protein